MLVFVLVLVWCWCWCGVGVGGVGVVVVVAAVAVAVVIVVLRLLVYIRMNRCPMQNEEQCHNNSPRMGAFGSILYSIVQPQDWISLDASSENDFIFIRGHGMPNNCPIARLLRPRCTELFVSRRKVMRRPAF